MAPFDSQHDANLETATNPTAVEPPSSRLEEKLAPLAHGIGALSVEVADIVGAVDFVRRDIATLAAEAENLNAATGTVAASSKELETQTEATSRDLAQIREAVRETQGVVRNSGDRARQAAEFVRASAERVTGLESALSDVARISKLINSVAAQTNLLALNATLEAARAGAAGLGFAVVAKEVKALAAETRKATTEIDQTIKTLVDAAGELRRSNTEAAMRSDAGAAAAAEAEMALEHAAQRLDQASAHVQTMAEAGKLTGEKAAQMAQAIEQQVHATRQAASQLEIAANRGEALQSDAEELMQHTVAVGAETLDTPFIRKVQGAAREVISAFETALARHEVTEEDLFDENYQPIQGTDPVQYMTRFTLLTDRLLRDLQERMLGFDKRIVFCAAVDRNGYLPTHNLKFSAAQRPGETAWNVANCRNRRIFDDRTGLGAARNQAPFLLQAYRRDMGGGKFALMKDCSAPILIKGRHWGGLRLAYLAE